MKLHPNPPRLVTVGLAVVLAVIGFIYAWPLDGLIPTALVLTLAGLLGTYGTVSDRVGVLALAGAIPILLVGMVVKAI